VRAYTYQHESRLLLGMMASVFSACSRIVQIHGNLYAILTRLLSKRTWRIGVSSISKYVHEKRPSVSFRDITAVSRLRTVPYDPLYVVYPNGLSNTGTW
jgi:hypothetical protein